MKQLDLFAGIGGISLAAEWAGIETVAFCEKEPFCQKVLRARFPGRPIYDDVFDLTAEVLRKDGIDKIDIVSGGFPCQPFSHAGKRTGTADDRYLWPEMLRIVDELKPHWVLAENVEGLVSMAESDWQLVMEDETTLCEEAEMVLETIRKDLEKAGYQSVPIVIPAAAVGASHRRYRVFIVAHTSGGERQSGTEVTRILREMQANGTIGNYAGGRSAAQSGEIVAYSQGGEDWRREQSGIQADVGTDRQVVAHASGAGREERDVAAITDQSGQCSRRGYAGDATLADSYSGEGDERRRSAQEDVRGCCSIGRYDGGRKESDALYNIRRAIESRMGRGAHEFSNWLDGRGVNPLDALAEFIAQYPQPALMGQPQHDWEPPRVATGIGNCAARLKALGNAVDPLQVLPVLYGIRIIHDFLVNGGKLK